MTMPGVGESNTLTVSSSTVAAIREKLNQKGTAPPNLPGTYFPKTKSLKNASTNEKKKTLNNNSSLENGFKNTMSKPEKASQNFNKKTSTNVKAHSSLQVLMPKPYQSAATTRTPSPNVVTDSDDNSATLEKSDSLSSVNTTTSKSSTDDVPKSYISEMKSKFESSSSNGEISSSAIKTAQDVGETNSVSHISSKFDLKCIDKKPGIRPKPSAISKAQHNVNSDSKITRSSKSASPLSKAQPTVKTNSVKVNSNTTSKISRLQRDLDNCEKQATSSSTNTNVTKKHNVNNVNEDVETAENNDSLDKPSSQDVQRPSVAQLATAFSAKNAVPDDKVAKNKSKVTKESENINEKELPQKNESPPELPPKGGNTAFTVRTSQLHSNKIDSLSNQLHQNSENIVYNFKSYKRKSIIETNPGPPPPKPFKPPYLTLRPQVINSHNALPPIPPPPMNFIRKGQNSSINERIRYHRPPPQPPPLSEICRKPLPPPPPEEETEDSATDYYDDSFDEDDDSSELDNQWIHNQFRDAFNTSGSVSCSSSSYEPLHNCESFASTDELNQEHSDEDIYEVVDTDTVDNSFSCDHYTINYNDKIEEAKKRQDEKKLKQEQKEKEKRDKELMKIKEKFNLTGEIVKLESGLVKKNCRGRSTNLSVKAGEKVYIIRINDNPPGKWLVQNEKDKIGYVDLTNIDINPDAIRNVMSTIHNLPVYSDLDNEDIYQSIA